MSGIPGIRFGATRIAVGRDGSVTFSVGRRNPGQFGQVHLKNDRQEPVLLGRSEALYQLEGEMDTHHHTDPRPQRAYAWVKSAQEALLSFFKEQHPPIPVAMEELLVSSLASPKLQGTSRQSFSGDQEVVLKSPPVKLRKDYQWLLNMESKAGKPKKHKGR